MLIDSRRFLIFRTIFLNQSEKAEQNFGKIGHNGALTLGENVGDLVGLTFAYNAAFPGNKKEVNVEDQKKFFLTDAL